MVKSFAPFVTSAALLLAVATSASLPNGSWPASKGTVQYSKAYVVKAGEVFDGKMKTFERSDVSCEGQSESGADTAVFNVETGGHLKNVIIGKNQMEGVHCDKHDCIIENVWWDDVCEDALSVKGGTASSVTKVIGGGARYADDKVIQHNGFGTVDIDGFYGEDISKLYRSCGTCGNRPKKVSVSNTYVLNPTNAIVTVNKNWGDQATLRNVWVKSSKPTVKVCQWSQGNANGEPKMLGHGPSNPLCKYSESDTVKNTTASVPDGTWPASTGIVRYKKPYTIKAGEVFDGKMQIFERSDITCSGGEGQKDTAVFLVEAGGTLKNAIIGKNQKEGVHCDYHDCTIENVWWDDVCEDALSIKGGSASSVTTVTNCGARYAEDKVVQHNGYGTVKIKGFFAQEFGKLYRSCGTCGNIPRKVTVENVFAIDPLVSVVTVNKNNNDQATLKNIFVKTTDGKKNVKVCQWSQASKTPSNVGDGPSGKLCQYSTSDVHINED
ncbi:polysaccharide lyase, putative [Phytophthora infestans T30-4]|uniref:Probable pectate lyase F n=1 Tax=Phytophthora infestans (strain T30-4) TaxID=403677 RepID=D0P0J4_PHYIT|nr:polysaccharide lyase, putative [Phytophthora infestans T30-4]EEY52957.1 polysaccharide lyase, putative [Phytophthora infestans T30-4]|eukprot:XP_002896167.1 polysaccharide lyase, putative [Phytophthora infestans T30-4]